MNDNKKTWQTSKRSIEVGGRTLVMGVINVTPDSFSDGGSALSIDEAVRRAERLIAEGADILDVGGESTRPGSIRVSADEETRRVVPVVEAISQRFDTAISIDTSKAEVAEAAVASGAEIINDISGLRFDELIGEVAAHHKCGIILMHSRGEFESMHKQEPVADILEDVSKDFHRSINIAENFGVNRANIVLDLGIGFGKTLDQNLELIAKIDKLAKEFPSFPLLAGASRKSFIGKITGADEPADRMSGSLAAAAISAWNGASIVRVHDVLETVECLKIVRAIKDASRD